MTLYTFMAIATVLSQLLFAGLCLAQHLTFAMHFNLQGARPQILKANHTHSTNIYWKNRGVTEAAWSVCLGQNSSQWTFSSIHSTKNFFLLTLKPIRNNQTWLHHEHPGGRRVVCVSSERYLTVGPMTPPGTGSLPSTHGSLNPLLRSLRSF